MQVYTDKHIIKQILLFGKFCVKVAMYKLPFFSDFSLQCDPTQDFLLRDMLCKTYIFGKL